MTSRPIIAITMGDPAGVGPEISLLACLSGEIQAICRPVIIGDLRRLKQAARILGRDDVIFNVVDRPEDGQYQLGTVDVIDLDCVPEDLPWGEVSAAAGDAAYRFIERATQYAVERRVGAICTAPLNKEALYAGGHSFPGHTEMLADLTGTPEVSMLLTAPKLRVIHVTTHVGLLDAVERIDVGLVERTILRGHDVLVRSGIPHPRIAVCGINPHAGEHGLFGRGEEETKINPAVEKVRLQGIDAVGALPADSVFFLATRGDFDLVVAMYHDQGHGPIKALGIEHGVNITVGLPVVRTSVDHGTAFDIAGTGRVDPESMYEAMRQAVAMAPRSDE
jgi:4-phospho-D-threonate 3-dehydrogenase / 4-phospho-D-erythronate 3-dehydrogenase